MPWKAQTPLAAKPCGCDDWSQSGGPALTVGRQMAWLLVLERVRRRWGLAALMKDRAGSRPPRTVQAPRPPNKVVALSGASQAAVGPHGAEAY